MNRIDYLLENDTSYKPQPICKGNGLLDGIICGMLSLSNAKRDTENIGKRKTYEEGF